MFIAQGPRFRGGSCAICTGPASNYKGAKFLDNIIIMVDTGASKNGQFHFSIKLS